MSLIGREKAAAREVLPRYLGYLAFHVALSPFLAYRGIRRARRRAYNGLIRDRLLGGSKPPANRPDILIVAGGLGEVRVAGKVAETLREARGVSAGILTQTIGGLTVKLSDQPLGVAPFNNPISAWICLRRWRPKAVLVVEFWDNHHMKMMAAWMGVPSVVFNVPITEHALEEERRKPRSFWRWRPVGLYAVQAEHHRQRLLRLGVEADQIEVTGPIGLGIPAQAGDSAATRAVWRETLGIEPDAWPVVVAGSTHADDEAAVLPAFAKLREKYPKAALVLAPRVFNRPGGPEQPLVSRGLPFRRRTQPDADLPDSRIVLLDTQGELPSVYAAGDIAFVGGTFHPTIGGHTPVEPLAWGIPITTGPSYAQQATIVDYLVERGCVRIAPDGDELAELWDRLAGDEDVRRRIAVTATRLLADQRQRTLDLFDSLNS